MQNYLAGRSGGIGGGRLGGFEIPGTNVIEKQVIFGGGSRLREQIKNTVKVIDGSLYIVLNGCESAMVGDDAAGMTGEAKDQGLPVACCRTAGLHGDSRYGYSRVMWDLIEGARSTLKDAGTGEPPEDGRKAVNVLGIVPGTDIFFRGDVVEITRILEGMGLRVNSFFGPSGGAGELASAPDADLSIVFSEWGRFAGDNLEEKYGVPQVVLPSLPVGCDAVNEMARVIAERLSADGRFSNDVEKLLERERRYLLFFLETLDDYYDEIAGTPIAIVGDASSLVGIGGFLKNYLGAVVEEAIVTDSFGGAECLTSSMLGGIAQNVSHSKDGHEIREILKRGSAEIVIGSAIEEEPARHLNAGHLVISYPGRGAVMGRTYSGTRGAVLLAEDYLSKVMERFEVRESSMADEILRS
jgi:nitrogenase molybdenum-iron protein beta chain